MLQLRSIQSKLLFATGSALVIILSVLALTLYFTESSRKLAEMDNTAINILDRRKDQTGYITSGLTEQAKLYSEKPEIQNLDPRILPDAIKKIISSTSDVSRAVGEITYASEEQKTGVSQISDAIIELDRSTQQNAALVEETALASEEITNQMKEHVGIIQQFSVS